MRTSEFMFDGRLDIERICLRQFASIPDARPFERLQHAHFIQVKNRVELLRQAGFEIMAQTLCLRPVNDPDCALEPFLAKKRDRFVRLAQIHPETREAGGMKKIFVTARECGTNALSLGRVAPIRRSRNCAGVCREADGEGASSKMLARELPNTEFAALAHCSGTGVARMRIVRPDHNCRAAAIEMREQLIQRLERVLIAQLPSVTEPSKRRAGTGTGDH